MRNATLSKNNKNPGKGTGEEATIQMPGLRGIIRLAFQGD
jgi:hypothetical protein